MARGLPRELLSIAVGCLVAAGSAISQPYPSRPVRIIAGFAGGSDLMARMVAQQLTPALGQQVYVEPRLGAAGNIGFEAAARAAPDGYTLLTTSTPHVILPHLHKKIPFDALKDFAPIMQFGDQPYALTIHPSLGVTTVKELIVLAQRQPGKINYASSGNGGAQHMFAALFASMAKIDMVHIPYKGAGPGFTDLVAGHVQLRIGRRRRGPPLPPA